MEKISDCYDLALLKIDLNNTKYFKLAKKIRNGEKIYTFGNPNGMGISFLEGVVSNNDKVIVYNENKIETFQTSFVINEGNSGGPIFNKYGKLLGVISFRLKDDSLNIIEGVSFGISFKNIDIFIN